MLFSGHVHGLQYVIHSTRPDLDMERLGEEEKRKRDEMQNQPVTLKYSILHSFDTVLRPGPRPTFEGGKYWNR